MEWRSVGIIVAIKSLGDIDAVVTVLTPEHGLQRGFVKAARTRLSRQDWQVGNRVDLRFYTRLAEQLGSFRGETVTSPLPRMIDRPLHLVSLVSACAVCAAALLPVVPMPRTYARLDGLLNLVHETVRFVADICLWELELLAELGYGLDLPSADRASEERLAFVLARTGDVVSAGDIGSCDDELLALPSFMLTGSCSVPTTVDLLRGLALTGYFLNREVFGGFGRKMPMERAQLISALDRRHRLENLPGGPITSRGLRLNVDEPR